MAYDPTLPFDVNYDQDDAALKETTRADASKLAGFTSTEDWQQEFNRRFEPAPAK